ncbi:hypothetical protein JTB14_002667 [Gonioctena quinquepunctata]|nr:hypothetical protein JTB14_002667 [Gonioctena quinquepunctata]
MPLRYKKNQIIMRFKITSPKKSMPNAKIMVACDKWQRNLVNQRLRFQDKLQPLDEGVYAPSKSYYNAEFDSWIERNPGQTISIYKIASLSSQAMVKALTPTIIQAAFKKAGIFPFYRNVLADADILLAAVTDGPDPKLHAETDQSDDEQIQPHVKAAAKKRTNRGRKPAKTRVLTNTTIKDCIIAEIEARKNKKQGIRDQKIKNAKRRIASSPSEDETGDIPYAESAGSDTDGGFSDVDSENSEKELDPNYCVFPYQVIY